MEKEFDNPLGLTKEQMVRNITEPFGDYDNVPVEMRFNPNSPFMKKVRQLGREIGLPD